MIVAAGMSEEILALQHFLILKEERQAVKQYQGTSGQERDPQGVTSAQPPAPSSQKTVSNRKNEAQKKIKATKPGESREHR